MTREPADPVIEPVVPVIEPVEIATPTTARRAA
jgi:hypothetical protein